MAWTRHIGTWLETSRIQSHLGSILSRCFQCLLLPPQIHVDHCKSAENFFYNGIKDAIFFHWPFFFGCSLFHGSPNIQAIKFIMNLNSLLFFVFSKTHSQYQVLRSFYHQNDPNNNKEKTLTLVQLQLQWINWKKIKKRKHNVEKKHACKCPRHLSWAWRQYSRGGCAQRSEGAIACSSPTLCGKTSFSSLLYYFLLLLLSLELSWADRRKAGEDKDWSFSE